MIYASISAQTVESHFEILPSARQHYLQSKMDGIFGEDLRKAIVQFWNKEAMAKFDWTDVDYYNISILFEVVWTLKICICFESSFDFVFFVNCNLTHQLLLQGR
jgi:hypothetical protein